MHDTPPFIEQKVREMMQKKSPIERLEMGLSMYRTAKQIVIYSILENRPNISESALRQEVFLRFYENDFNSEVRNKILKHLADHCPSK